MNLTHTAFFGDGEHTFALTDDMIAELERITDLGIGAIHQRIFYLQFKLMDLFEIIRLSLIGGGMKPERSAQLVDTYARNRPIDELFPLALDILNARWGGDTEDEQPAPNFEAAASGDMAAALNGASDA
ncbi:gene transfer agent family protein [Leisingera sp. S232]|uniref:gene transfer agent family protein n=1 Tax=Leisingera sp. S232 TaxID=3415132 RepID=UPI003C79AD6A